MTSTLLDLAQHDETVYNNIQSSADFREKFSSNDLATHLIDETIVEESLGQGLMDANSTGHEQVDRPSTLTSSDDMANSRVANGSGSMLQSEPQDLPSSVKSNARTSRRDIFSFKMNWLKRFKPRK
ncbi:hypothetical protein NliqN6_6624 [Naganishia liquefaciens]|uniref:Uncharacterized protein n=1 Tax=Naganishia liquefaciens TaxID=104408 RepID=A0A8H3YJJ1_9TREE|nr:hypothetical protein NliqN6_6624 [Naganishia liquefaciens]